MTNNQSFYQQLINVLQRESVVMATIVKVIGSAPREVGAKMAVCGDGNIIGTIGGGAGEGEVIERSLKVLETGEKQLIEIDLTGTSGEDVRGICGGKVKIWLEKWSEWEIALVEQILESFRLGQTVKLITPFTKYTRPYLIGDLDFSRERDFFSELESLPHLQFIETIQPSPTLLIVGGGHVGVALAKVASLAGFQIAVQDDRAEFVTSQRFPQALHLFQSINTALDTLAQSQLYVALVTRGYPQDLEAMQTLLQRPVVYQYIGAIGSQKRIRTLYQVLQQQGIPLERLQDIYAPIGLDIGALTPEEIAVSICGELIKVRRGGTGKSLSQRLQNLSARSRIHLEELAYAPLP
ncbi:XdhC family protein [Myxosarcina sp. GI1]|uniref:XdhC family protein n=1 Tax=Myxosarcina sp. GI1 TaxID=1541065 RepID=UPI0006921FB4|nr:XdhC/CoxI family protein [Myxosarcina sp. GI1]